MAGFIVKRLFGGVLLILGLTLLTYVVFFLIPLDPGYLILHDPRASSAELAAVHQRYHLDDPLVQQYGRFLWGVARHGDLGHTYFNNESLTQLIGTYLPVTGSLVLGGVVVLLLLALPLGVLSATRPHGWLDRTILGVSIFGIAVHPFVLAILLRSAFAHRLHVAPDSGYCQIRARFGCGGVAQWAYHLWVPWIVFALFFLPLYTRMIRSRVLETAGEQWVTAARAKGASELRVLTRHVLRNSMLPVLPMVAIEIGTAVTAAIYIETVFGIPGIGRLAVSALSGEGGGYDLPTVVAIVFTIAVCVVVLNVIVDITLAALDPRIGVARASVPIRDRLVATAQRTRHGAASTLSLVKRRPLATSTVLLAVPLLTVALVFRDRGRPKTAPAAIRAPTLADIRAGSHVIASTWTERKAIQDGFLEFHVRSVAEGPNGWVVGASITNRSRTAVGITAGDPDFFNWAGLGLVYPRTKHQQRSLVVIPAAVHEPAVPQRLGPGSSWSGEFAGSDQPPRQRSVYVAFGFFTSKHEPVGFNWITDHTFVRS